MKNKITMRHIMAKIIGLFLIAMLGIKTVNAEEMKTTEKDYTTKNSISFNKLSTGLDFKRCWIGSIPQPYVYKGKTPGGEIRKRLGGLCWEIDLDYDGNPHICGRTMPGFRHFEMFEQQGPSMQPIASYDLGSIAPLGKLLGKTESIAQNWTNFTISTKYQNQNEINRCSVTVSRLTPAVLVETDAKELVLFGGKKETFQKIDEDPKNGVPKIHNYKHSFQARNPKGIAIKNSSGMQLLKEQDLNPQHDKSITNISWGLFWWGNVFDTTDSPDPVLATHGYQRPWGKIKKGDVPVLAVFENNSFNISVNENGGVVFRSAKGTIGKIVLFPLMGCLLTHTDKWAATLPETIVKKAEFWAERISCFPTEVQETYSYDKENDTVAITNHFQFKKIGKRGKYFAPLPPMLALASKFDFPVKFKEQIIDTGYVTPVGPFNGSDSKVLTFSISGLNKYVSPSAPEITNLKNAAKIKKKLETEIDRILAKGHPFRPGTTLINRRQIGKSYPAPWSNPGDTFYILSVCAELFPEKKKEILSYVAKVGKEFPPDTYDFIPYDKGISRLTGRHGTECELKALQREFKAQLRGRRFFFPSHKAIPPENMYAVSKYLNAGGVWNTKELRNSQILLPYLKQMDWANMGFFRWDTYHNNGKWGFFNNGFYFGLGGVSDINRMFSGLIGFTRIAEVENDKQQADLGRYLFAKFAITRFAIGKFSQYLYDSGQIKSPETPKWYIKAFEMSEGWGKIRENAGYPIAFNWKGAESDIRQVVVLDEFGPSLRSTTMVYMNELIPTFNHITLELGIFLKDHLQAESAEYIKQLENHMPDWYVAYGDSALGSEASFSIPENSYQIFMAKRWILEEKADGLFQKTDIPWCPYADYYYIMKLLSLLSKN